MECHAQAALHRAGQDEASLEAIAQHWSAANRLLSEAISSRADDPRLPWLVWQDARCDLIHAQSALASYLATPANAELRDTALSLVREVMSKTDDLLADLKRRQPLAARQGRQSGSQAPAEQLAKLSLDVALLQCEALLIRVRL